MLNLRDLLYVRREGNVIQLGVKDYHNALILLGSSVRAAPGSSTTTEHRSITLFPEQEKGGIIAVSVVLYPATLKKRQDAERIPALLLISWDATNRKHFLDIAKPWMSESRFGFATGHGVSVTLNDGATFVTANAGLRGTPVETDALCKYLAGELTDEELREVVFKKNLKTAGATAGLLLGVLAVDLLTSPDKKDVKKPTDKKS